MKEITDIKEIQKIEVGIMAYVDKICRENNIKYFLSDGTAIGAVRHKGFIPWDDDIDICMPRQDYEKFLSIMDNINDKNYKCLHLCKEIPNYYYTFAKVVDLNTTLIEDNRKNNETMGVWIDVFPLDGVKDEKTFIKDRKKFRKMSAIINLSASKKFIPSKRSKLRDILECLMYLPAKALSYKHWNKKARKIEKKYKWDYSDLFSRYYGEQLAILPRTMLDDIIDIEFEGHKFSIMKDYDTYLTTMYGDYMTPPPEDKRVTRHNFKAYWREK